MAFDGSVYFSDITFSMESGMQAGHIWRYDPQTGQTAIFRSPSGMSNGLKFDALGRLIAAEGADFGGQRVTRTDLATGKAEIIAGLYKGRPFNAPNDISIDEKGRIYFSDPRYLGHEPIDQPVMAVYRIDPDGTIERIITDAGKPNGVCVSPDQQSLYVVSNDNGQYGDLPIARHARAQGPDGTAGVRPAPRRHGHLPRGDGRLLSRRRAGRLVVDAEGNLYVAVRDVTRPGIVVYAPSGDELAYIPTPEVPTNVAFGRGAESKTLYVTYGGGAPPENPGVLAKITVGKDGYHLPAP